MIVGIVAKKMEDLQPDSDKLRLENQKFRVEKGIFRPICLYTLLKRSLRVIFVCNTFFSKSCMTKIIAKIKSQI